MKFLSIGRVLCLALATQVSADAAFHGSSSPPVTNAFTNLKVGGGGWVVKSDISKTGVRFAGTDVAYGYMWGTDLSKCGPQAISGCWINVVRKSSMPAANFGFFPTTGTSQVYQGAVGGGMLEIAGAPSDATTGYMNYAGKVFVSTNIDPTHPTSFTWVLATAGGSGFPTVTDSSNNAYRMAGRKMAIDPNNRDHVIVGTQTQGLWETFNGTAGASATWAQISTGSVPLSTAVTNYNIAFDQVGTMSCPGVGGTCSATIYIFSSNVATPGVYQSSDGGATYVLLASSPTPGMSMLVVAPSGHILWAVDNPGTSSGQVNGNLWKFVPSTPGMGVWTKVLSSGGNSYHSVAVNPNNVNHMVALGNDGSLNVSTDGGATWGGVWTFTRAAGDAPWNAWAAEGFLSAGNVFFDPLQTDVLVFTGGQSIWTTPLPVANNFTWTSIVDGVEEAIAAFVSVPVSNRPTIGYQDVATFTFNSLNNVNQSTGNPVSASKSLEYASGIDFPPNDPGFMAAKISADFNGNSDYSGYSTDRFINDYTPFNTYNTRVHATAVSNNGSGKVRVTVSGATVGSSTTSGLTVWSAGQGSIICTTSLITVSGNVLNSGTIPPCFPVTAIDAGATYFDITAAFTGALATTGGDYVFYVAPQTLLTNLNGVTNVTGASANAGDGKIKILYMLNSFGQLANGLLACVSGIGTGSTTEANGCWITEQSVAGSRTAVLGPSSTFTNTYDTTKAGGSLNSWGAPGGSIATASRTNFTTVAGNGSYPLCSDDGGKSWVQMSHASIPATLTTITGGPYAAGATSIQVTSGSGIAGGSASQLEIPMDDGRFYTGLVNTKTGTAPATLVMTNPIPTGRSIADAAPVHLSTGWGFAAFLNIKQIAVDQVQPNTFFAVNGDAGMFKWTHCGPGNNGAMTQVNTGTTLSATWQVGGGSNYVIKTIPGESGHLFYTAGTQGAAGANHPANTGLWRACNGDNNSALDMTFRVNGFFEPTAFGYGKAAGGHSYPTLYVVGWYDAGNVRANAVYGIWGSVDDPNHGNSGASAICMTGGTWTKLDDWPNGWMSLVHDIQGDPSVPSEVYLGTSSGSFLGVFNYLLQQDLTGRPANDNFEPAFLARAG